MAGEQLETDATSRAIVNISSVGQLEVEPNTQLRLLETREGAHRVALDRGVIHAMIWAPPGEFLVSTGYLPGAHRKSCPVYPRVLALGPAWARAP